MPDISERLVSTTGATITAPVQNNNALHPPTTPMEPGGTGFTRCPMPPVWQSNPDSLRYFYRSGQVPQWRTLTPSLKGS